MNIVLNPGFSPNISGSVKSHFLIVSKNSILWKGHNLLTHSLLEVTYIVLNFNVTIDSVSKNISSPN